VRVIYSLIIGLMALLVAGLNGEKESLLDKDIQNQIRIIQSDSHVSAKREATLKLINLSDKVTNKNTISAKFLNKFSSSLRWIRECGGGACPKINMDSIYCSDLSYVIDDFNKDGKEELCSVFIFTNGRSRYILIDAFHLSQRYGPKAYKIDSMFIRDVNRDGFKDIVILWSDIQNKQHLSIKTPEANYPFFHTILEKHVPVTFGNKGEIYISHEKTPKNTYVQFNGQYVLLDKVNKFFIHKKMGFSLMKDGKFGEAVKEMDKALKQGIKKGRDSLLYYKGICLMKAGKPEAARRVFFEIMDGCFSYTFKEIAFKYYLMMDSLRGVVPANYNIKSFAEIHDSLQSHFSSRMAKSFLHSIDIDNDSRDECIFGKKELFIVAYHGKISKISLKEFSPSYTMVKNNKLILLNKNKKPWSIIELKFKEGLFEVEDSIILPVLHDFSKIKFMGETQIGDKRIYILVGRNRYAFISTTWKKVLAEGKLKTAITSFRIAMDGSLLIGTSATSKEMDKGDLPSVLRFSIAGKNISVDTIFLYPFPPPFGTEYYFYGAGYTGIVEDDIDGDGVNELLLQEYHYVEDAEHSYYLRILKKKNGVWKNLWNTKLFHWKSRIITADVNGNGIKEIFADNNTGYCKDQNYHVRVIEFINGNFQMFNLLQPYAILLGKGDFDGDNRPEVAIMVPHKEIRIIDQ